MWKLEPSLLLRFATRLYPAIPTLPRSRLAWTSCIVHVCLVHPSHACVLLLSPNQIPRIYHLYCYLVRQRRYSPVCINMYADLDLF
jgi:hypothetical protein